MNTYGADKGLYKAIENQYGMFAPESRNGLRGKRTSIFTEIDHLKTPNKKKKSPNRKGSVQKSLKKSASKKMFLKKDSSKKSIKGSNFKIKEKSPYVSPKRTPIRSPRTPLVVKEKSPAPALTPVKSPARTPIKTPIKTPVKTPVRAPTPEKKPLPVVV